MSNSTGVPSLGVKQLESREEHFPPTELEFQCVHYIKQPLFSKMMKYRLNNTTNVSNSPKHYIIPLLLPASACQVEIYIYIYMCRPSQSVWLLCVHTVKKKKNPQVRRLKRALRKVMCWWWKISPVHWCQLAIHSPDNANVLDSGSSYTWIIMCWWVWASVCHETRMTEW